MMIAPNKGISFAIIEPEAKRGIVHYCSGTRAETSTTLPQIPVHSIANSDRTGASLVVPAHVRCRID
ncbi:hypothetical protein ACFW1P_14450 [Paenibacillus sp. NPDC058910]|uniref:hypothetical protein n=1 Tax=Paenibacillus sp. NPDC058910 TaxID=3346670 RepID=UPI0036AB6CF9